MAGASLAAVVMAGGLGTRMRSATPKHLHPILGRRMVDWVLEAARPLGPDPLVVIASPESRDEFGDTSGGRAGAGARHGRRRPLGAGSGGGERRERPRPLRRHAAPHDRAARGARRGARARGRRRDRPLLHPRRRPLVRADRPRTGRDGGGDRRGRRCHARAAGDPGVQLVDLRLPRRAALARARPARAAQRPGRALPHRRRPRSRRARRARRRPRRRRSRPRPRASTPASSWLPQPPPCATGSTASTCSRASESPTPARRGSSRT